MFYVLRNLVTFALVVAAIVIYLAVSGVVSVFEGTDAKLRREQERVARIVQQGDAACAPATTSRIQEARTGDTRLVTCSDGRLFRDPRKGKMFPVESGEYFSTSTVIYDARDQR
jgi:hypothetical protein